MTNTDDMALKGTRVPLFALLAAGGISMVGNVLAMIAVPWFVLQTTGSASLTGLTATFTALPAIVAAFFGGTLVDRIGYKRMSVVSDVMSGVTVALIPLLYHLLGARFAFWQLLVLVFLGALLDAPGGTARLSILPDVARVAGMRLERVNSAMQAIQRGSNLLGAPLAGFLIAVMGADRVLWLDAASFAVSALMVAALVPSQAAPNQNEEKQSRYLEDLKEGLRFIWRDRVIFAVVATVMITNFLDAPLFAVIMPVYVSRVFGSAFNLGLIIAGFGAGALLGTIIFGAVGHRLPRRLTFALSFIVVGLQFFFLALLPPVGFIIAAFALLGLASGPLNPIIMTVVQERVPADMRGRVFGTMTAGAYLAVPLGMLLAGYMIEWKGVRVTLLIQAGIYLVTTLSLLINPALREMDKNSFQ
ncbi:MAG TPA: MFS transporter [Pyrinomonadaceae bacterium]|nr:MFS transporter [Pyrinomonadaceae bacterium]